MRLLSLIALLWTVGCGAPPCAKGRDPGTWKPTHRIIEPSGIYVEAIVMKETEGSAPGYLYEEFEWYLCRNPVWFVDGVGNVLKDGRASNNTLRVYE